MSTHKTIAYNRNAHNFIHTHTNTTSYGILCLENFRHYCFSDNYLENIVEVLEI